MDILSDWFSGLTIGGAGLVIGRTAYCIIGRAAGFYNPDVYHLLVVPGWRPVFRKILLPLFWWYEELFKFGGEATARPAGPIETISLLYKPGGIFIGRLRLLGIPFWMPVGTNGGSGKHLVMVASTGSGKTLHLVSMLGLHRGTAMIIDPKGQMTKIMLRRMGKGGAGIFGKGMKVGVLDPSGLVKGHTSWHWNCFDEVFRARDRARKRALADGRDPDKAGDDATVEFTQKILEGLIVQTGDDKFWSGSARDFCLSVALWMIRNLPREQCTLMKFYELLTLGLPNEVNSPKESGFEALLRRLMEDRSFGGIIAAGASGLKDASGNTAGSVLFTIREALQWIKRPALRQISDRSDFSLEELHPAYGSLVLFISCKLTDIRETFPGYFRLLTVLTMATFEDINMPTKTPCMVALDEFGNLGYLSSVATSAAYMRSFGVRLLCILQNLKQLEAAGYGNPETFVGNAELVWWFATTHKDNLEYLVKRLGQCTIKEKLDGNPWWKKSSDIHTRHGKREREVMTEDQATRYLSRGNVIVTHGGRPLFLKADPYIRALPVCFYDADTDYKEKILRRVTRKVLRHYVNAEAKEVPVTAVAKTLDAAGPMPPANEDAPATRDFFAKPVNAMPAEDGPMRRSAEEQVSFSQLFKECFDENTGVYPHPKMRRRVSEGFGPLLIEEGDLYTQQMHLEDWLISELPKERAEHIIVFFDDWLEHARERRTAPRE